MGATVAQTMAANQRAQDALDRENYRRLLEEDRQRRAALAERRTDAAISQGAQRINISRDREARQAAGSSSKGVGKLDNRYEYRMGPNGQIQRRLKQ